LRLKFKGFVSIGFVFFDSWMIFSLILGFIFGGSLPIVLACISVDESAVMTKERWMALIDHVANWPIQNKIL